MLAVFVLAALVDVHTTGINLYVGDRSAELGYVTGSTEADRIRGHLLYAHDVLAAKDVSMLSPDLRAARAKNLARLYAYARAGEFPRNDGHPDALRPTFVDEDGAICAVGALFASDRGYAAADRIAKAGYKYAFIEQLDDPELLAWQATSGLGLDELGLIQPSYEGPPSFSERMWLPFGLADRATFGAARLSLTSEVSSATDYNTMQTTVHAQSMLPGFRTLSIYATLPIGLQIQEPNNTDVVAAGGPVMADAPRSWLGNGDIGFYFGKENWTGPALIARVGALLPTGTDRDAFAAGMRVGDLVLERPRSYGVRAAASKISGWERMPSHWFGDTVRSAWRVDLGVDFAREVSTDEDTVVPRAATSLMFAPEFGTLSFDTALAYAFTPSGRSSGFTTIADGLRWSAGTTFRRAHYGGRHGRLQPAISIAAIRAPDGWSGVVAFELGVADH